MAKEAKITPGGAQNRVADAATQRLDALVSRLNEIEGRVIRLEAAAKASKPK